MDDMAHLAQADVTICGASAFCTVASLLNPKCVLTLGRPHSLLTGGVNRIHYDMNTGCLSEFLFFTNTFLIGRLLSRPFSC